MRRFSSSNRSALEAAAAPGPAPFARSICVRVVGRDHQGESAAETGGGSMSTGRGQQERALVLARRRRDAVAVGAVTEMREDRYGVVKVVDEVG